jgi:hypothetical protein
MKIPDQSRNIELLGFYLTVCFPAGIRPLNPTSSYLLLEAYWCRIRPFSQASGSPSDHASPHCDHTLPDYDLVGIKYEEFS